MIAAIETVYNGYRFRSRLEARWAVFFDALGIKYEYEKEGFSLASGPYLPDFWLPAYECWVEIKGNIPTERERRLAEELRDLNYPVCLFYGLPGEYYGMAFMHDVTDSSGGASESHWVRWCICLDCGIVYPTVRRDGDRDRSIITATWETVAPVLWDHDTRRRDYAHPRIQAAFTAAKQARFEHGETPTLPPDTLTTRWQTLLTALAATNPSLARVLRNAAGLTADDCCVVLRFASIHAISCAVASRPNNGAQVEALTRQYLGREYTFRAVVAY